MIEDDADPRSEIITIARDARRSRAWCRTGRAMFPVASSDGLLITPAGRPLPRSLRPADIVAVALPVCRVHARVLVRVAVPRGDLSGRPDAAAIVHTHSPEATALAWTGRGIPPFHYMIALAGGDIRRMPYATFGTAELAATAVRGLDGPPRGAARQPRRDRDRRLAAARRTRSRVEVENLAGQYLALLAAGPRAAAARRRRARSA